MNSGAGGIVGQLHSGTVENSYSEGIIYGGNLGGGIACILNSGTIKNSYSSMNITAIISSVGADGGGGGGLVGWNLGTIENCYSIGNVNGTRVNYEQLDGYGGLVGHNAGIIRNSYSEGSVSNTGDGYSYGGLVGVNSGTVENSYSIGNVTGVNHIGGLVGFNENGTYINSFWDIDTSGQTSSAGGEGKTTAEMQTKSTFTNAGWDFVNIWTIRQRVDYPRFRWQALPKLAVSVDIKPGECPNPLNVKAKGLLSVAILGSVDFDVWTIATASVRLEGVAPVRSSYEDVATPMPDGAEVCECTTAGPDGRLDLTLKFNVQDIVAALGQVNNGDELELTLTGALDEVFGGTPIEGTDCVVIQGAK